jgi:N6-adenosine-specific RNA methylase IME4
VSGDWGGLTPPYSTIVADPPWHYETTDRRDRDGGWVKQRPLPYSSMSLDEIRALPVGDLTTDGRVFMWTTNRYLRESWSIIESWGFTPTQRTLVWCKSPRGTVNVTTEFVVMGRKGSPSALPWHGTTWFDWKRASHSAKPDAFLDLVESWCPGPYVELFCRRPRLGWDHWGHGYEMSA